MEEKKTYKNLDEKLKYAYTVREITARIMKICKSRKITTIIIQIHH